MAGTVLDQLQGANEEQRRAALAALAAAGQRGVDAYMSAQGTVGDAQTQALDRARQSAGSAGLDANAQAQLNTIIGQPGDRSKQQLSAAQGQYTADNAARQAATSAYFNEVNAAVPMIKADADGKVALAKQAAEAQLAQQQLEAQRAQEEHAAKMAEYQARLAQIQAAQADAAKQQYTFAQQQQIAKGLADEQQHQAELAARQKAMDDRLAAEAIAYKAAQARPMELTAEQRAADPHTADRYERDDANVQDARKQAATIFNMPALADLMAQQEAAYNKPVAPAGGDLQPSGVTADHYERNSSPSNFSDQPGLGLRGLANAVAQMAPQLKVAGVTPDRQLPDLTSAFGDLFNKQKTETSTLAEQLAQLSQPDATDMARQAFTQFTGDPLGAFAIQRPDASDTLKKALEQAGLQNQLDFYNQTGYTSPSFMQSADKALNQNPTFSAVDEAVAKQAGIDPSQLDTIRNTGQYKSLEETAQAILDNFAKTGQIPDVNGDLVSKAPTADSMMQLLSAQFADDPTARAMIPVIIAELGSYLYNGSYDPSYLAS